MTATSSASTATPTVAWLELILLAAAQLMLILDVTVVNVALPDMVRDLSAPVTESGWPVVAYGVPFGGLLLLGGRLADAWGARRVLILGLVLFLIGSLLAGFSTSMPALLAARAGQGIGAALLSPAALASITLRFDGDSRRKALAVWAALGGAGSALGVILGGLITVSIGWRWIFFINVPVGALVTALLPLIPAPPRPEASNRRSFPLIPSQLLRRPGMRGGVFAMFIATGLIVGAFFLASFALQSGLGWTSLSTGLAFLPVALATLAGAHLASHLLGHLGSRPVVAMAFVLAAGGFGTAMLSGLPLVLIVGLTAAAAGLGAGFVAASVTALSTIPAEQAGSGSGLLSMAHELGGAAAVGLLSVSAIAASPNWGFAALAAAAIGAAVLAIWLVPNARPPADGRRFMH